MTHYQTTDSAIDDCMLSYETINMDELNSLNLIQTLDVFRYLPPLCDKHEKELVNHGNAEKFERNENNLNAKLKNSFGKKGDKILARDELNNLHFVIETERNPPETKIMDRNSAVPLRHLRKLVCEDRSLLANNGISEMLSDEDPNLHYSSINTQDLFVCTPSNSSLDVVNLSQLVSDNIGQVLQESQNINKSLYNFPRPRSCSQAMHNSSVKDLEFYFVPPTCRSRQDNSKQTYSTCCSSTKCSVEFMSHGIDASQALSLSFEKHHSWSNRSIPQIGSFYAKDDFQECNLKTSLLNQNLDVTIDTNPTLDDQILQILDDICVEKFGIGESNITSQFDDFIAQNERDKIIAVDNQKCVNLNNLKSSISEEANRIEIENDKMNSSVSVTHSLIVSSERDFSIIGSKPNVNSFDGVIPSYSFSMNTQTSVVYVYSNPLLSAKKFSKSPRASNGGQIPRKIWVPSKSHSNISRGGKNSHTFIRNNSENHIIQSCFNGQHGAQQENALTF